MNPLLLDSISRLAEEVRREAQVEKTALEHREFLTAAYEKLCQIYELASKS